MIWYVDELNGRRHADAAALLKAVLDNMPSSSLATSISCLAGPGLRVLADIIASARFLVVRLTEVFRQAAQSKIITNAHRINQGIILGSSRPEGDSDFYCAR